MDIEVPGRDPVALVGMMRRKEDFYARWMMVGIRILSSLMVRRLSSRYIETDGDYCFALLMANFVALS